MKAITERQLEGVVYLLNKQLDRPVKPWERVEGSAKLRANVGNLYVDYALGGVSLVEMITETGAVDEVFLIGHVPKRELYNRIQGYFGIARLEKK